MLIHCDTRCGAYGYTEGCILSKVHLTRTALVTFCVEHALEVTHHTHSLLLSVGFSFLALLLKSMTKALASAQKRTSIEIQI